MPSLQSSQRSASFTDRGSQRWFVVRSKGKQHVDIACVIFLVFWISMLLLLYSFSSCGDQMFCHNVEHLLLFQRLSQVVCGDDLHGNHYCNDDCVFIIIMTIVCCMTSIFFCRFANGLLLPLFSFIIFVVKLQFYWRPAATTIVITLSI